MNIAVIHIPYDSNHSFTDEAYYCDEYQKNINNAILSVPKSADLIVFPAGLFVSHNKKECGNLATHFVKHLPSVKSHIAFGVDYRPKNATDKELSKKSAERLLKCFMYCVDTNKNPKIWDSSQLGFGSKDSIPYSKYLPRVIIVDGKSVAFMLCGETTSRVSGFPLIGTIRKKRFIEHVSESADIIAILAHSDVPFPPHFLNWRRAIKSAGKPCVLTEHIYRPYLARKTFVKSKKDGPDHSFLINKSEPFECGPYIGRLYKC